MPLPPGPLPVGAKILYPLILEVVEGSGSVVLVKSDFVYLPPESIERLISRTTLEAGDIING